jgi:uncharacterized protein
MKSPFRVATVVLAWLVVVTQLPAATARLPRIAVADFTTEDNSFRAEVAARDFSTALQALLADLPGVDWVERAQLAEVEKEHGLAVLGFSDPDRSLKLGKWARADLLLTGWFHDRTATNQALQLEVIDLNRAEVLAVTNLHVVLFRLDSPSQVNASLLESADVYRQLVRQAADLHQSRAEERVASILYFDYLGSSHSSPSPALLNRSNGWTRPFRKGIEQTLTGQGYRLVELTRAGNAHGEAFHLASGLTEDAAGSHDPMIRPADLFVWGGFKSHDYDYDPVKNAMTPRRAAQLELFLWDGRELICLTNFLEIGRDEALVVPVLSGAIKQALAQPTGVANPTNSSTLGDALFERAQWQLAGLRSTGVEGPENQLQLAATLALFEATLLVQPDHQAASEELLFLRLGSSARFPWQTNRFRRLWKASETWAAHTSRFGFDTLGSRTSPLGLPEGEVNESRYVAVNYLMFPQQLLEILQSVQAVDKGLPRDLDFSTLERWREYWVNEYVGRAIAVAGRPEVQPFTMRILGFTLGISGVKGVAEPAQRRKVVTALWPAMLADAKAGGWDSKMDPHTSALLETYRQVGRESEGRELIGQLAKFSPEPQRAPLPLRRADSIAHFLTNGQPVVDLMPTPPAARPNYLTYLELHEAEFLRNQRELKGPDGTAVNDPLLLDFAAISNRWAAVALSELKRHAVGGDPTAACFLGWRSELGRGMPTNKPQAALLYRQAAEAGLAEAQRRFGIVNQRGIGIPEDHERALYWMRLAADRGFTRAEYGLGWLHENDSSSDPNFGNFKVAAEWYEKAALKNHAEAQFRLGRLFYFGKLGHDHPRAAFWFRKAADQHHLEATFALGDLLRYNHQDLPPDLPEAIRLYRLAAARGHRRALFELGTMYAQGEGLPPDLGEAKRLLDQAAGLGDFNAPAELARVEARLASQRALQGGNLEALPGAVLSKAAEQNDWRAHLEMARRREAGEKPELDQALHWHLRALRSLTGHQDDQTRKPVESGLGQFMLRHPDIEVRSESDLDLLDRLALNRGFREQSFMLLWGRRRHYGLGVPQDVELAVSIYEKAIWWKSPEACLQLAVLWDSDLTRNHEPKEATAWLRLGRAFRDGYGTAPNMSEAWRWFKLAAEQGNADSQRSLDELTSQLGPEELEKAQALVLSFHTRRIEKTQ